MLFRFVFNVVVVGGVVVCVFVSRSKSIMFKMSSVKSVTVTQIVVEVGPSRFHINQFREQRCLPAPLTTNYSLQMIYIGVLYFTQSLSRQKL